MARLPLFPLNTVLFPGMQARLHIFEDRYKLMINRCMETGEEFGVVLIRKASDAMGKLAETFMVGCAAKISEAQRLPMQRLNIVTVGQRRFRIRELHFDEPYLVGEVEYFMPSDDDPPLVRQCGRILRPLLVHYLDTLHADSSNHFDAEQLPDSPRAVAQIASILLHSDNYQKQQLLEMDSLSKLLETLIEIYRVETMLLDIRLSPPGKYFDIGPFSSN
ncbi:MAG: LON peptidase substrate-binding domain-containing protein [Chloroflexota bacterium]|nr:LON peptidase substrate-binding domain-containing protein [Chloroflexota bacterium]